MFEWILEGIKAAWCWLLDFMLGAVIFVIDMLVAQLPPVNADFGPFITILTQVNSWVPLDFFFTTLVAYNAFLGTFIVIKLLLKLTPGVG